MASLLMAATLVSAAGAAWAQSTPVLSRNQINLVNGIETIASIRMEPRRTQLAATLAEALQGALEEAYAAYFGDFPNTLARTSEPIRRSEVGRLTCRLYARENGPDIAVFIRCILGNLTVNIMDRGDILLTPKREAIPAARATLDDIVRRIAYSFRQAHGLTPLWTPDRTVTREEILGIGRPSALP